jgi:GPI mannosyltransferase 2
MSAPLLGYQYFAFVSFCLDNPNVSLSPWCADKWPNVYQYVQDRYWNVGLFRYYQLHQLPNFAIAAPTLLISISGIFVFVWSLLRRERGPVGLRYVVSDAAPFVVHWFFLTCIALSVLHIQVVTRFMSATPPFYWFASAVFLSNIGPRIWLGQPQFLVSFGVLVFFLAFLVIGCLLHTNFYPWT